MKGREEPRRVRDRLRWCRAQDGRNPSCAVIASGVRHDSVKKTRLKLSLLPGYRTNDGHLRQEPLFRGELPCLACRVPNDFTKGTRRLA